MLENDLRRFIRKNRECKKSTAGRCATKTFMEWLNKKDEIYDLAFLDDKEKIIETLQEYATDIGGSWRYFYSEKEYVLGVDLLCSLFGVDKRKVKKTNPFGFVPPNEELSPIPLKPTVCNLCGGKVSLIDNSLIYGKSFGSGKCYRCDNCGAYVGTHKPWPDIALGILSNDSMRNGRKYCHAVFDALWQNETKNRAQKRQALYDWLTEQMGLPRNMGHFGYFNLQQLQQAYQILKVVDGKKPLYGKCNGKALKVICFIDNTGGHEKYD